MHPEAAATAPVHPTVMLLHKQVAASKAAALSSNPCPFCNRESYTVAFSGRKTVSQRQTERSQKLEVEEAMVQARLVSYP